MTVQLVHSFLVGFSTERNRTGLMVNVSWFFSWKDTSYLRSELGEILVTYPDHTISLATCLFAISFPTQGTY